MAQIQPELRRFCENLPLISPRGIDRSMRDLGYKGQYDQTKAMALMAYRHIRRIKRIYVEGINHRMLLPKQNSLLIGPTGCGKTFLVELLFREVLQLPTIVVDITSYTESGYVGESVSALLTRLVEATNGRPYLARCGIICLDEFDKLAASTSNARFAGQGTTKDVSGYGVQRELLTLLEGFDVQSPLDHGFSQYGRRLSVSTRDIPFVACGAFSGLMNLLNEQQDSPNGKAPDNVNFNVLQAVDTATFQKYGFLPELIGRFARIVHFPELDKDTLELILCQNVLPRFVDEFQAEGVQLTVTKPALKHIVQQALERQTGARALEAELLERIEGAAYETFLQNQHTQVIVNVKNGVLNCEIV